MRFVASSWHLPKDAFWGFNSWGLVLYLMLQPCRPEQIVLTCAGQTRF